MPHLAPGPRAHQRYLASELEAPRGECGASQAALCQSAVLAVKSIGRADLAHTLAQAASPDLYVLAYLYSLSIPPKKNYSELDAEWGEICYFE